jgi:hypothetical protein
LRIIVTKHEGRETRGSRHYGYDAALRSLFQFGQH